MKRTMQLILMCCLAAALCQGAGWVKLFDGKTLNGWELHSGNATYVVDNGTILGTAVLGSPNSFLCTKKEYGDFILDFEVKVDPELNSGVQFRSQIHPGPEPFKFMDQGKPVERKLSPDRVYGYQVEIATRDSASSGNVYDEARRGRFLDDFSKRLAAKTAFKDREWNKYRIECKGDSIRTWVNGVLAADFKDSMTAKGIFGLQVHAVGKDRFKPFQVRWRNIRIKELD
jgi:hypothetical protein